MIILNFSHPLTESQIRETETLAKMTVEKVLNVHVQFDNDQPFMEQILPLAEAIPLDSETLQTAPILIVLPSSNFIAAELLAWLHGLMGYFPAVLRIKPKSGSIPPAYEAAEILSLQSLRDTSRKYR